MRSDQFQRAFERIEAGAAFGDVITGAPREVADALRTAELLRGLGSHVSVPEPSQSWDRLFALLEETPQRGTRMGRAHPVARALAVAAAFVLVASYVSLKAKPGSLLYPVRRGMEQTALVLSPNDPRIRSNVASARLGDLQTVLRAGPIQDAPALARELVADRKSAVASGASVSALDHAIATDIPPLLGRVNPSVATSVRSELGSLLPPGATPPAPSATPAPSSTPSSNPGPNDHDHSNGGNAGSGGGSGSGGGGGSGGGTGSGSGGTGSGSGSSSGGPPAGGGGSDESGDSGGGGSGSDSSDSGGGSGSDSNSGGGSQGDSSDPSSGNTLD